MKLGAALVLLLLARPDARAELCAARVELEGDTAVVGQVGNELARLGVERGVPAPGCRGVRARVEADGDGVAVAIRDGSRRSEGRVVSDPAIAASWIDSWLHDDLDGRAWLLAAPVTLPAATPRILTTTATSSVPRPAWSERAQLAVSWEHAWTDDDASADGFGVAGCVRVGMLCVGGRGRYLREADRSVAQTAMGRSELSLLATIALPVHAGRMSIAPELGLGVGRTATRRIEGCMVNTPPDPSNPGMPNCDPMDPTCVIPPQVCGDAGKVFVGDEFSTATLSPRFSAGVRLAVPLFDHVWLDGAFAVAVSPMSHGDPFANTGEMVGPDGTMVKGTSEFALPGEPVFGMWLGIGLRVGGQ